MQDQELREAGLKVTEPRLKVLRILEYAGRDQHLSAEDVYKTLLEQGEDVGLATVYRVLTQFESAGLVRRHNFEGVRSVFELDQGEHHDHLVCTHCGLVKEFFDETIEKHQEEIANQHEFKITDHSHTIYGVCKSCLSKS